jgi:hypothetical protein
MDEQVKSKKRELHPRKLIPPPEIVKRIMDKDKEYLPKNKMLRFFKIFLGEGF